MKHSKKSILLVIMIIVMLMTAAMLVVGCGNDNTANKDKDAVKTEQSADATEESPADKATKSDSKPADSHEAKATSDHAGSFETKTETTNGTKANKVDKATEATKPTQATNAAVCYVSVEGYCSSKTITIQSGDTAYSVLKKTGATVSAENTSMGIYVKGINGRFASGSSGWKYSVNGSEPNYSAGSYSVKSGDTVKWYWGSAY